MSSVEAARAQGGAYRAALIAAASVGDSVTVIDLVDGPLPPDVSHETRSCFLSVALLRAAQGGHLVTIKALTRVTQTRGDNATTQIDVSRPNTDGNTPLHLACENGDTECVNVLLEAGANLAVRNAEGKTPIAVSRNAECRGSIAAEVERRKEVAKVAQREIRSTRGNTAHHGGEASTTRSGSRPNATPSRNTERTTSEAGKAKTPNAKTKVEFASQLCPASPGSFEIKQKLKDDLKCVVCLRDFCSEPGNGSAPITLPCGHNFCCDCVGGMRGTSGDENQRKAFRCPLDRTMFSRHLELKVNGAFRDLIGFMHSRVNGNSGGDSSNPLPAQPRRSRLGGNDAEGCAAPNACHETIANRSRAFCDSRDGKENGDDDDFEGRSPRTPTSLTTRPGGRTPRDSRWGDSPSPRARAMR